LLLLDFNGDEISLIYVWLSLTLMWRCAIFR